MKTTTYSNQLRLERHNEKAALTWDQHVYKKCDHLISVDNLCWCFVLGAGLAC